MFDYPSALRTLESVLVAPFRPLAQVRGGETASLETAAKIGALILSMPDNMALPPQERILEILKPDWLPIKMRAYGTQIGQRQQGLRELGVMPVEAIPVRPGKNSVDFVLIMDALEELFCGKADSIAIASGDSDFTPLALKIREHGKPILIFGHSFTPPALRMAATQFHCIGWFQQAPERNVSRTDRLESSSYCEPTLDVRDLLRSRIAELICELAGNDAPVTINKLGAIIADRDPIFTPKRYGSRSLSLLLNNLGGFTLTPVEGKDGSLRDYVVTLG